MAWVDSKAWKLKQLTFHFREGFSMEINQQFSSASQDEYVRTGKAATTLKRQPFPLTVIPALPWRTVTCRRQPHFAVSCRTRSPDLWRPLPLPIRPFP